MQIQSGIGLDKPHSRRAHESLETRIGTYIVCHDWRTRDPSTSRTGKYRTATRWLYAVEGAFATA